MRTVRFNRENLALAADGCLITAGTFAIMMGAAFILQWLGISSMSEPDFSSPRWPVDLFSWLLQVGAFFIGPLVAWKLSGRRFTRGAILGGALGFFTAGAVVMAVSMTAAGVDWLVRTTTSLEYVGAIAFLVVLVALFVFVAAIQDFAAVRDLASNPKHRVLDIGRLVATLGVVGFVVGTLVVIVTQGGGVDPAVFMLAAGIQGAVVVTVADAVDRYASRAAPAVQSEGA